MHILPAIDLQQGRCVRLAQGRADAATEYSDDPLEVARSFARDGARELHVVDLDAAFGRDNSLNSKVLERIVMMLDVPVQTGGGVRSLADAEHRFALGVARVVVGTIAVEAPHEVERMIEKFGARIVVGIDARDGEVMTRGWEQAGKIAALELAQRVERAGVEQIVYTDVSRDGMLSGVNIEQTVRLARESGLRVTASGGIASLDDIIALRSAARDTTVDSVIVGKALYENRFTLPDAIIAASGNDDGHSDENNHGDDA